MPVDQTRSVNKKDVCRLGSFGLGSAWTKQDDDIFLLQIAS